MSEHELNIDAQSPKAKKSLMQAVNSLLFATAIVAGGVAFWTMPQKTISEDEKRELAKRPEATVQSVFFGEFGKKFENYYNDHFIYRDDFMAFSSQLNSLKGKQDQEFRVINASSGASEEKPAQDANVAANTAPDTKQPDAQATNQAASDEQNLMQQEFSKVKGMVVVNGRVVQNFGGSEATVKPFIGLVNDYYNKMPDIKHYAMIIPAGSDFYLPPQVTKGEYKEKKTIEIFNQSINPNITSVPVYDELLPHKNEYIMYRTDHHWTGLGAYYAYRAFAKAAGFTPLELSQMEYVKANKDFLGSLFLYTKDNELKKNPDIVEYYKIPNQYTVTMQKSAKAKPVSGVLYYPNGTNYGVFLGGDHALTHITSDVKNGKKILMIKDSFGNAFAPFLAAHYEEVFVIDYRYYKSSIPKLIRDNGIGEFIYAHNSFAANSNAAVNYGKTMLAD